MNEASAEKDLKFELTKLRDDGLANNYAEFEYKAMLELQYLDLWKYVDGPESNPPKVPLLRPDHTVTVIHPETGEEIKGIRKGNEAKVKRARDASEPWKRGNH